MAFALTGAAATAYAQQLPSTPEIEKEMPPVSVIEGKVRFPSGHSIDTNVKVILSTKQGPLFTIHTNSNGEFRFTELREGIYYIEIIPDTKIYEIVTERIWLKREQHLGVSIYLTVKKEQGTRTQTARTVSAIELNQGISSEARKKYESASKLIRKGEIRQAIERLRQAISIAPDYLMARNDLGVQYLKMRRFDEAAEQFKWAIEKNPKYFSPKLNLGLVYVEQGKFAEAVNMFQQAIAIDSSRPAAHLWLGIALLETDERNEAERELVRARLLGGAEYSVARFYLAHIYLRNSQREEARRELEAYLEESPSGERAAQARLIIQRLKEQS